MQPRSKSKPITLEVNVHQYFPVQVIKRLPGNGEPEYRIKNANEPHERVARESELIKA